MANLDPANVIRIVRSIPSPDLKGGGGGGNSGGMEERVATLEANVGHIRTDVGELKSDVKSLSRDMADVKVILARIEAELSHKVDYKWLTVYVLGLVAVLMREEILAFFRAPTG